MPMMILSGTTRSNEKLPGSMTYCKNRLKLGGSPPVRITGLIYDLDFVVDVDDAAMRQARRRSYGWNEKRKVVTLIRILKFAVGLFGHHPSDLFGQSLSSKN